MAKLNRIAVVGGGIAGLSAAYYLNKFANEKSIALEISVYERQDRWGGKITTERVDDFVIEGGPDTFVVTKPWALNLCKELGIADRLQGTNPDQKKTYILHKGDLHPIPDGLTMMIPTNIMSMLSTGLLTLGGKMRMGMDAVLPSRPDESDVSMQEFVTRRLGTQAYENLIEPLMSGIYAGDGGALSVKATLPYLLDLEKEYGSLVRGALAVKKKRSEAGGPVPGSRSLFLTPNSGLQEIVETLTAKLELEGVGLYLNTEISEIKKEGAGFLIRIKNETIRANSIILAPPAFIAADLVQGLSAELSSELKAIEYVSTATITLAYFKKDLPRPLDGYGYVIPRREGRQALACTWTSTKFPHRAPEGKALIRVFVGRAGQESQIPWDEAELLKIAKEELRDTLSITAEPLLSRVWIWEKAMPQYNVGHLARLDRIDQYLEMIPGLALAGNAYRGVGIPDCIHSGETAAINILNVIMGEQPQDETEFQKVS